MSPLFHDRFGKFSPEEGEILLGLLLLRKEIAQGQVKLLVKRAELRGEGFLLFREVARKMRPQKVLEFLRKDTA